MENDASCWREWHCQRCKSVLGHFICLQYEGIGTVCFLMHEWHMNMILLIISELVISCAIICIMFPQMFILLLGNGEYGTIFEWDIQEALFRPLDVQLPVNSKYSYVSIYIPSIVKIIVACCSYEIQLLQ